MHFLTHLNARNIFLKCAHYSELYFRLKRAEHLVNIVGSAVPRTVLALGRPICQTSPLGHTAVLTFQDLAWGYDKN